MRKIAHVIKLDLPVFIQTENDKTYKVINLYIDEFGAESGGLIIDDDGIVMSCDSNIWDEYQDYDTIATKLLLGNWPYVSKSFLRDDKLNEILK